MSKRKAGNDSDWRYGFLFVGNQLALDFLNTRPVQNGEPVELLCDFSGLLRWFEAADLLDSHEASKLQKEWDGSVRARRVVIDCRELRERLREQITAWEHGDAVGQSMVDELNKLMTEHPMLTRLKVRGDLASAEISFEANRPDDLFAPLAHSAAILFANVDRHRVRKCSQCVLHFFDTSKKGTRQWCSMRLCGNRVKVAAYATRRRSHCAKEG